MTSKRLSKAEFVLGFKSAVSKYSFGYATTRRNGIEYRSNELDEIAIALFETLENADADKGPEAWLKVVDLLSVEGRKAQCIPAHSSPFSHITVCDDFLESHLVQIFTPKIRYFFIFSSFLIFFSESCSRLCHKSQISVRCLNIHHYDEELALEDFMQAVINHLGLGCKDLAEEISSLLTGTVHSNRNHFLNMLSSNLLSECCLLQHNARKSLLVRVSTLGSTVSKTWEIQRFFLKVSGNLITRSKQLKGLQSRDVISKSLHIVFIQSFESLESESN